tara:strand:+ start:436 stop:1539 length:1104 start_codon:yes stop_codon:yes gene_type:complete
MKRDNKKISLFIPSLQAAGAEKIVVNLANSFSEKGYDIDLVVLKNTGYYFKKINSKVKIINLKTSRALFALYPLIKYLKKNNPDVLLSSLSHLNIISIIAGLFNKNKTKVLVVEHNDLRNDFKRKFNLKKKLVSLLILITYRKAYKVIAVSNGVLEYILSIVDLDISKIKVIHNPIFEQSIIKMSKDRADHKWLINKNKPVILGVGRLTEQKNFELLIKAFVEVRKKIDTRLIIIGDGHLKNNLMSLIDSLELQNYVSLPGFVKNPYAFMANSSLFVLSSNYEGFGNVIVEAMACGTPIVSTDCFSGPSEILQNGYWGTLVPVKNLSALANAIIDTLNKKEYPNVIKRAKDFSIDLKVDEYLKTMFS